MALQQYLSQPRIESPIWLEPNDMSFLRTRISDIENQVQSIDYQTSQLIQLKDAKTAEITLLRNIFSPIRRLPLETLSEIFEHVCLDSWPSQKETHHSMLPIGALYSACVLSRRPKLLNMIEQLENCSSLFYLSTVGFNRWLYAEFSNHSFRFSASVSSSLPLLEKLHLSLSFPDQNFFRFSPLRAFLGAPKLHHVEIHDSSNASVLRLSALSAEQLTCLNIGMDGGMDPAIYVEILTRCENLVSLTFSGSVSDTNSYPGFAPNLSITLSALTSLAVTCNGPQNLNFLRCLTTPLLEELNLQLKGQGYHDLHLDIAGWQERSKTTALWSSTMSDLSIRQEELESFNPSMIAILSILPTITLLKLGGNGPNSYDIGPLIKAMIYSPGDSVLLPKLVALDLDEYPIRGSVYSSHLMQMIFSAAVAS